VKKPVNCNTIRVADAIQLCDIAGQVPGNDDAAISGVTTPVICLKVQLRRTGFIGAFDNIGEKVKIE